MRDAALSVRKAGPVRALCTRSDTPKRRPGHSAHAPDQGTHKFSGDEGARTPDPRLAKPVLYQLSYVPASVGHRVYRARDGRETDSARLQVAFGAYVNERRRTGARIGSPDTTGSIHRSW